MRSAAPCAHLADCLAEAPWCWPAVWEPCQLEAHHDLQSITLTGFWLKA
jgi:hypothetical protein